jgi:omega-6 fatty acid desaturase / acyl-lipid omega-6 desaturase (Delta-12 desaturase)
VSRQTKLSFSLYDLAVIYGSYKAACYLDSLIATLDLPNALAYTALRVVVWAFYTFFAGLFGTGIWVIGHECGHQAFSESKTVNSVAGWILHSAYVQ